MTYCDKKDALISAMKIISDKIQHLPNFDPTEPASYNLLNLQSKKSVESAYFAAMNEASQRLAKCVETEPSLKRSLNFLKKVIETKNFKYTPKQTDDFRQNQRPTICQECNVLCKKISKVCFS